MRFKVTTPVETFTGTVAGVAFAKGSAEVDGDEHRQALSYFREAGYSVEPIVDEPADEPPADPPTPPVNPAAPPADTPAPPAEPPAPEPEPAQPKPAARKTAAK